MIEVPRGTIAVYSDIGCPWAHLAVWRLLDARRRLGFEADVRLDHRAFPLEIVNRQPTPRRILEAETPVIGALGPEARWRVWQADEGEWPVTTLPALEAVQAAKAQGLDASEILDRALRVAFFGESRCISMRHVILEVAEECDVVDVDELRGALDSGRSRPAVLAHCEQSVRDEVNGSPHVFVGDGTDAANPGIDMRWEGEHGEGFPVVEADRPEVYDDLLRRASEQAKERADQRAEPPGSKTRA